MCPNTALFGHRAAFEGLNLELRKDSKVWNWLIAGVVGFFGFLVFMNVGLPLTLQATCDSLDVGCVWLDRIEERREAARVPRAPAHRAINELAEPVPGVIRPEMPWATHNAGYRRGRPHDSRRAHHPRRYKKSRHSKGQRRCPRGFQWNGRACATTFTMPLPGINGPIQPDGQWYRTEGGRHRLRCVANC